MKVISNACTNICVKISGFFPIHMGSGCTGGLMFSIRYGPQVLCNDRSMDFRDVTNIRTDEA